MRSFFNDQAIGVGRIIALFVINFLAILALNWKLALASIAVVPVILVVSLWFFKKVTKAYEAYQEQEAILSTTLQENLTGVRVVKAFARQDYEKDKFEKDNLEKFLRGRKFIRMHSLFWPLSDIACGFQMLVGFVFAAYLVIHGEISVGTYPAYVGLVVWLIWPMRNLGRLVVQTSTGLVSHERLMEIVRQEREPLTDGKIQPKGPVNGEIVFENVSFQYEDGSNEVLKNISFRCQPGQAIALLGSTGSGKTSLVNLLPRFHDYTGGHILLDGVELKDYSREYLRQQIGIVEQEPFLFSRSIRENIMYGVDRDVPQAEIEKAAKAAAVHEVILTFPDGYNTLVGEKGVTLSGGQKQRVAVARTLLKNPRILILDDSTSSVDTETEAEIRAALNQLMENRTTFIIAHRIQSVMNADLILVMDKGAIVQMGRHEELVTQEGMYRQIYNIQTRIDEELEQECKRGTMSDELIELEEEEYTSQLTAPTFTRIAALVKPHWRWMAGFLAAIVATAVLDACFTYINKLIIDQGIVPGKFNLVMKYAMVYGGIQLVESGLVLHLFTWSAFLASASSMTCVNPPSITCRIFRFPITARMRLAG